LEFRRVLFRSGISTYQISPRRDYERSTKAHNTVTIDDQDTAEVWSGFRVGRRPTVNLLKADERQIQAQLTYAGLIHKRTFTLTERSEERRVGKELILRGLSTHLE